MKRWIQILLTSSWCFASPSPEVSTYSRPTIGSARVVSLGQGQRVSALQLGAREETQSALILSNLRQIQEVAQATSECVPIQDFTFFVASEIVPCLEGLKFDCESLTGNDAKFIQLQVDEVCKLANNYSCLVFLGNQRCSDDAKLISRFLTEFSIRIKLLEDRLVRKNTEIEIKNKEQKSKELFALFQEYGSKSMELLGKTLVTGKMLTATAEYWEELQGFEELFESTVKEIGGPHSGLIGEVSKFVTRVSLLGTDRKTNPLEERSALEREYRRLDIALNVQSQVLIDIAAHVKEIGKGFRKVLLEVQGQTPGVVLSGIGMTYDAGMKALNAVDANIWIKVAAGGFVALTAAVSSWLVYSNLRQRHQARNGSDKCNELYTKIAGAKVKLTAAYNLLKQTTQDHQLSLTDTQLAEETEPSNSEDSLILAAI